MRTTPDLTKSADQITDPIELYARIGYRTWRSQLNPKVTDLMDSFNKTDLKRVATLQKSS